MVFYRYGAVSLIILTLTGCGASVVRSGRAMDTAQAGEQIMPEGVTLSSS